MKPGERPQKDDPSSGPRIERLPRWNERFGSDNRQPPPGGQDEDRLGGRGNQRVTEVGGPPIPEE